MTAALQPRVSGLGWFIVQTGGHAERLAKAHLQRQGFEVYLPMRPVKKKTAEHAAPFFPRFLFVRVDAGASDPGWQLIRSTQGVQALLKKAGSTMPWRTPDSLIAWLKGREVLGLVMDEKPAEAPKLNIALGETVKLTEAAGSMSGYEAMFLGQIDARRVQVLLSFMGREARFELGLDAVRKAG